MKDVLRIDPMTATAQSNISSVIRHYSSRLLHFIRKRVRSDEDAEDILQDVFSQFIVNPEPIEQVTAWLFRVTRNKITDQYRKKKLDVVDGVFEDPDDENSELLHIIARQTDDPEREYLRNFFWEALQDALNELPEPQRQVFILSEIEGISFKEIAEKTGESVNTLLSRKRYAVLHLRERLRQLKDELLDY